MLVALTGASGFVGSYTAAALKRRGHVVRALVRPTSRREHIASCVDQWCVGDQADPQAVAGLLAGADAVVHNSVDWDAHERGPLPNVERNLVASLTLLELSRQFRVGQFIFVSSVSVYHEILPGGIITEDHPTWPDTTYGACKAAVESHLKAYHHRFGANTSAWRPAAIYGVDPALHRSQWFELVKSAREGRAISTAQGGKITHVQDVADALADAVGDEGVAGQFYNLVDQHLYWQVVAQIAGELSGSGAVIEDRRGAGPKNQFDTRKALAFYERHGNRVALRRGLEGVRQYVGELLARL